MFKKKLLSLIFDNKTIEITDINHFRNHVLLNLFLIVSSLYLLGYAIYNIVFENYTNLVIDITTIAVSLILFVINQVRRHHTIVVCGSLFLFSFIALYFFIRGNEQNTGLFFSLVYPTVVFFVFGKKKGIVINTIYTLIILFSYLILRECSWFYYYNPVYFSRFFSTYILILALGFTAELVIEKSYSMIKNNYNALNRMITIKDNFIRVIAHDLKGPMGSYYDILSYFESNFEKMTTKEKTDTIKNLKEASQKNFQLLNDLLQWAKMQGEKKMKLNPMIINLYEIIKDEITRLKLQLKKKELSVSTSGIRSGYIYADPEMTATVVRNLLSNAVKYSYRNSSIEIDIQSRQDTVRCCIIDHGTGIREKVRDRLFTIDYYSSTPGTENERGSGFGLILSKEILEQSNGSIWFTSTDGHGSKFFFSLPKYDPRRPDST